ncbi:hypothetical protein PTSG_01947 [Salpingoeca rosetta]|uniref:Menorin-like domain-containing protein n=1 Tax=Salpingoeca rosetta (strain ATCC 50818 / BSB-021) TaxID=946362 RepID=F2TZF0_SALR5|nr:uncharacterized protein PTSG_01947 [Salpingoeca rosetta]EGD78974.1 hypothetical protein PTSG_01947 [Salpingoeca rosetta]|eukprot:XP_004997930.1 hypothetical protein PTSG_01947 [Salpingoeca rosetta]
MGGDDDTRTGGAGGGGGGGRAALWAHAVNSKAQLEAALAQGIVCIEADVLLSEGNVPILAHPPERTSDITVEDLLQALVAHEPPQQSHQKIVKLDFKDPAVVQPSLNLLDKFTASLSTWEVWLNADILKGPGGAAPLFDADAFVSQCKHHGTLSLGWTTSMYTFNFAYTMVMATEMIELCQAHELPTPPTFAMSACCARESPHAIAALMRHVHNATITLWGLVDDPLQTWANSLAQRYCGHVYIDCLQAPFTRRAAYAVLRALGVLTSHDTANADGDDDGDRDGDRCGAYRGSRARHAS